MITKNVRFLVGQRYVGDSLTYLVLREQIEIDRDPNAEGSTGKIQVDASDGKNTSWKLSAEGQHGDLAGLFYRTKLEGCCAAPDEFTFYSLSSGEKVYRSNLTDPFLLLAKDDRRYIAYFQTDDDRGLLQYGDENHVIDAIEIRTPENDGSPLISASSGDRKSVQGSMFLQERQVKVAPILITLSFFEVTPTVIPLKDDRFARNHLTLPQGFSIAEAPH